MGTFVVMQTYRVDSRHRDEYVEALPDLVKAGMELGCVFFDIYEDDDEPGLFIEMMGFDSWTHYEQVRQIPPTRAMEALHRRLDGWIEGGLDAILVNHLQTRAVG